MNIRKTLFCFLLLCVAAGFPQPGQIAPERVQITILGTTDLHGNINPIDYYTNKPDNRGLAKVATLIKRIRGEQQRFIDRFGRHDPGFTP